jgi:hypothetical protein
MRSASDVDTWPEAHEENAPMLSRLSYDLVWLLQRDIRQTANEWERLIRSASSMKQSLVEAGRTGSSHAGVFTLLSGPPPRIAHKGQHQEKME